MTNGVDVTDTVRHNHRMAMTPTERQRAHRDRITGRITKLSQGHRDIIVALDGNDKALAVKLRAISEGALA